MTKDEYKNLSDSDKVRLLETALIDVLDGNAKGHEIEYVTGLPRQRCDEISTLFGILVP